MDKEMRLQFADITEWDRELFDAGKQFYSKFAVYPNILLASRKTYKAIDSAAINKSENIRHIIDDVPVSDDVDTDSPVELTSFRTDEYVLEFCIGVKMGYGRFKLVHDELSDIEEENV